MAEYRDLTVGPIAKKLYRFALPIILINLLQAIYNVVDMIIVGRFCGASGMVAVNQGGQIVMIIFVVISAMINNYGLSAAAAAGAEIKFILLLCYRGRRSCISDFFHSAEFAITEL